MNNREFQKEVVSILFDIYKHMKELDASKLLHQAKDQVDAIWSQYNSNEDISAILYDVSDLCFDLWAPMCENVLSTYQEIQTLLIPKLEALLDQENKSLLNEMLFKKNIRKTDFTKLTKLPYLPIMKHLRDDFKLNSRADSKGHTYDDAPYCNACQQRPCMCSDPERTSTVWNG